MPDPGLPPQNQSLAYAQNRQAHYSRYQPSQRAQYFHQTPHRHYQERGIFSRQEAIGLASKPMHVRARPIPPLRSSSACKLLQLGGQLVEASRLKYFSITKILRQRIGERRINLTHQTLHFRG